MFLMLPGGDCARESGWYIEKRQASPKFSAPETPTRSGRRVAKSGGAEGYLLSHGLCF